MYSKKKFGEELRRQLKKGFDVHRISTWAHDDVYFKQREFEEGLEDVLMSVMMMEMGNEFELSEEELSRLADDLASSQPDL